MHCAYNVMERADENLAEVLAERPLTPGEARELLFPLLDVLQYLDANGFAHGGLKPTKIMASGDQLKISSDGLIQGGDSAAACRAIGILLQQVLGADRNSMPRPFAEIAQGCLLPDPAARWNRARIEAHLRSDARPAARTKSRIIGWGLAATAATLTMIAVWPAKNAFSLKDIPSRNAAPVPPAADIKPPATAVRPTDSLQPIAPTTAVGPPEASAQTPTEQAATTLDGITRVLPEIPNAALNTITGRVRINVRIQVDSEGNVTQAKLEPPAASKYFTDRVLVAAQAWKFPAGNGPQYWLLHFELQRDQMRVSPAIIVN
jgi:serine/threonine protein kinase